MDGEDILKTLDELKEVRKHRFRRLLRSFWPVKSGKVTPYSIYFIFHLLE